MKDEIVTYETAVLAKEKGFDRFCFDAYNTHKMLYSNGWLEYIDDNEIEIPFTSKALKSKDILAPTQSLLQRYLREVHNIDIISPMKFKSGYACQIVENPGMKVFKTYEEALEKELQESLKLIKL